MSNSIRKFPVGWVAVIFVIFILVSTYLTTSAIDYPANASFSTARKHHKPYRCETGHYTKYISIGQTSYTEARLLLDMRVCWRRFGVKSPGQIVKRKTQYHVSFANTAWGDSEGWRWSHDTVYRVQTYSNSFLEIMGVHAWGRQCVGTPVVPLCGPAQDFYPKMQFMSPWITEPHMNNGIWHNWEFHWHGDSHVHIFDSMR